MTTKGRPAAALSLPVLGLRRTARLALLGSLVLGAASAWHWRAILDPITITATIARCPAAPLGFLAVHIVASMLFIPRTLLAIVAGLLFGMGWGIVLAASGSVAGAVAGFLELRARVSTRTAADDNRLRRFRGCWGASDARRGELGRTHSHWPRSVGAVSVDTRDCPPTSRLTGCQRFGCRPAGGPVEKLDRVHNRHVATGGKVGDAPDISSRDEIGSGTRDIPELPVTQR